MSWPQRGCGSMRFRWRRLSVWFLEGFDPYVLLWLLFFAGLVWSGVRMLTILEAEA